MTRWLPLLLVLLPLACTSSFEGIRLRAQSPSISEASRRLSLALRADDYRIAEGTILGLAFETDWRTLKESERGPEEQAVDDAARISVKLFQRGALYDIFLTITLRTGEGEYYPDPVHPIVAKWQKILREIVEEEFQEEG